MYDRLFTAAEVQALLEAASTPVLDGEVRVLQVLILSSSSHSTRPGPAPRSPAGWRPPALAAHGPV